MCACMPTLGRPQAEALCRTLQLRLAIYLPGLAPQAVLTLPTRLGQGEIMVLPKEGAVGPHFFKEHSSVGGVQPPHQVPMGGGGGGAPPFFAAG